MILVTDLKQWAYCRRIVYYRHVSPGIGRPTFKMTEAVRAQEMIESLEMRRQLKGYGFELGTRRFNPWLTDQALRLSGKIDLLLENSTEAAVVDFKLTSGEPGDNHILQLGGYALLVQACLGSEIRRGFVHRIPDSRLFEIMLGEDILERVRQAIADIQAQRDTEILPAPTVVRGRCAECEYQNYCADIW